MQSDAISLILVMILVPQFDVWLFFGHDELANLVMMNWQN